MPAGKDGSGNRRGGSTTKKNAYCSFCRKSYRDVGPLVEGPGDVYICGECIELCHSILDQEQKRRGTTKQLVHQDPDASRNCQRTRPVRDRAVAREEGPLGCRAQSLQAVVHGLGEFGCRD